MRADIAYDRTMDKQKSYGENYQQIVPKHKFSKKFFCAFLGASIAIIFVALVVWIAL
jgi:hypothetical protein